MALTFEQTKVLMAHILAAPTSEARRTLRYHLQLIGCSEPKFYDSVIRHGGGLPFASEEWFDFLSKIPTHVLRDERQILSKLSESQRKRLPPASLG
jgi:hypothetical protein